MKYLVIIGIIIGIICIINANSSINEYSNKNHLTKEIKNGSNKQNKKTNIVVKSSKKVQLDKNKKIKGTQEEIKFINNIGNISKKYYPKYKILPSVTIAQAILESNWGKSELSRKYNNYFGIKAHGYKNYISFKTKEEVNGKLIVITSTFRKYNSLDESIRNYNEFLTKENKIYLKNGILNKLDYKSQALCLQKTGYATDSKYSEKLIRIIEKYGLNLFD